jgi:hypothetical protein
MLYVVAFVVGGVVVYFPKVRRLALKGGVYALAAFGALVALALLV